MAQLDVQPKKNRTWWIWVFVTIFILALVFYFIRDTGRDASNPNLTGGDSATIRSAIQSNTVNWDETPFNSPSLTFEEVGDRDISIRGNQNFAIYSLSETILFSSGSSTIRTDAEQKLSQITSSIAKRFKNGEIRIYGYTDAEGSTAYNKKLAEQRAEAVKNWIAREGSIDESRISVNPVGEAGPAGPNTSEQVKQENRKVEIVATTQGK